MHTLLWTHLPFVHLYTTKFWSSGKRSFHIVVVEVFDKKMSERMRITQYYLDEGRSISEDNINERCGECLAKRA